MSQPLRVLFVEDETDDVLFACKELQKGGFAVTYQQVQTKDALRSLLEREPWDIVIADKSIAIVDGLESLRIAHEKDPNLPVIIISGYVPEEFVVDAMRAGAHDFISKDRLVRLAPSVRRALEDAEIRRRRHVAEEKAKEEATFRAAIEKTIPSGIMITDSEGKITYVNPAFCNLLGWSEANLVGSKQPYIFWPPEEVSHCQEKFWKSVESPGLWSSECRFRRADGSEIFVLRLSNHLIQEPGGRKSLLISFTDITELKRKDDALRKLNDELERRVEQRTSDLNETLIQLREAVADRQRLENELLEIVEKERQRFGLELHDDLGQHLSGLMMMTKALEMKLNRKRRPEALQATNIHTNLEKTVTMAKGMAKKLAPWNFEEGSLAQALESLAEQTRNVFGVRCRFQTKGDIPKLKAEFEMHLYKIAQEAVANGLKHGKARQVQITLLRNSHTLLLCIKSDGKPFPAVDPFKAGSGLRIMKYRANLLGATLDLKPGAKNAGTEVTCDLNLKNNGAPPSTVATAKRVPPQGPRDAAAA